MAVSLISQLQELHSKIPEMKGTKWRATVARDGNGVYIEAINDVGYAYLDNSDTQALLSWLIQIHEDK